MIKKEIIKIRVHPWQKYLEQFANYLMVERSLSKSSTSYYVTDVRQFISSFAESYTPDKICYDDIVKFISHLNNLHLASASIARKITSIKMFFQFLISEDLIKTDPAENIETPKVKKKLPTVLSFEVISKLITYT